MPASIALVGLAANDPVPGEYIEIDFAAGPAIAGQTPYAGLLIGNKMPGGAAANDTMVYGPDTPTPLGSEADAIFLFGEGSELHRMWKRWNAVNKTSSLYAIAVTESAGAKATGAITLTVTATGGGTLRVYVEDETVDVGITTGDTPTQVAANAVIQINGKTSWPVVASSAAGVLTLTAKQKGLRGNWLRFWSRLVQPCGTATSTTSVAFMTGGTTADDSTAALATIAPLRYYYIVSSAEDATQLGALVAQVNTQAAPTTGIRQRVFAGSIDVLANAQTIATGLNAARAELVWLAQSDVPPCELAASIGAVYALEEQPQRPRLNFSSYGDDAQTSANWLIKPPNSRVAPTRLQFESAMNNGLTPIGCRAAGSTYIGKRCTTRSLNGANPDYRIRDGHKVTVCDRYGDDLQSKLANTMRGKEIGDDPVGNQPGPGANVITERVLAASINKQTRDYDDLDLLQKVQAIIDGTLVVREASPSTRMTAKVPLTPIDILDQIGIVISQVG